MKTGIPAKADPANIADNLTRVRQRIADACDRVGRSPADVRLVAVTKYADVEAVRALIAAGALDLGENQVQQLTQRAGELGCDLAPLQGSAGCKIAAMPRWHLIGNLQRNKVKSLLPVSRIIHSLDSVRLAEEIEHRAAAPDVIVEALLEINIAGEVAKHGVAPSEASTVLAQIQQLPHLRIRGLMTMAPLNPNPQAARPHFAALRALRDELQRSGSLDESAGELSMGMSQDFEVAIEEGATIVRVGSALFETTGAS